MPLSLITGPANAAKARVVLDAARARAAASPLLVVPTFPDVERYRRELASGGAVLGVRVERFSGLLRELARRGGVRGDTLTPLQRERAAAAAVAATPLERLAGAARTPGFAPALVHLAEELGESRIEPPRFVRALRDWAGDDAGRRAYADELGALVLAYRRVQERTGRRDRPRHVTAALDALRLDPARWGATPVFLYGFDDLSPLQRDVVDTLANAVGAEVMLSLTFEPGRAAFAARATLHQELLALGASEQRLEASAEYYAPAARATLHHLERGLYEPDGERAAPDPGAPAVLAFEGGGERAEVELVAAEVARLIGAGTPPEEIAVVHRGLDQAAALVDQVFRAYGLPIALDRRIAAGHTALGRGLVALLRCALLDASADELLAWLRTPGVVRVPAFVDRLEARARRDGARTAREARALWEQEHWELEALDHLAAAHARGGVRAVGERLAAEAAALLAAPWRRTAPVLDAEGEVEARVAATVRSALRELAALPADLQPAPAELAATLEALPVFLGAAPGPGRVTVSKPQDLRARRVRALFCLGLQEGIFPAPSRPEPFLGDEERREINAASGLRLRLHEDALHVERLFFYAAVSRPTELLGLGWHAATDEGAPTVRSLLVDDVADLLPEGWAQAPRRRELGAAGWPHATAPTEREAARFATAAAPPAQPPRIAPLRAPAALGPLRERHTWSASQLEVWASCPVRWFVERHLRPEVLVPDPEPMIRGELAHRVLEHALSALAADGGGLVPDRLPDARRLVHAALQEHASDFRISPNPERLRSALRRLEVDLLRYLEYAAHAGSSFRPALFEVKFGQAEDPHPPLELDDGALRIAGRIDRVDVSVDGREALVYDYKGKTATPQARWLDEGKLQVALYLLMLRQVLGLEPVGGLYQPLGAGPDAQRPRGAVLTDADPGLDTVRSDRVEAEALEALLEGCAEAARVAVTQLRAGALEPAPERCAWGGGCAHPTICRCITA
jgi:ATP-dependent helicase/DNAse subunit B